MPLPQAPSPLWAAVIEGEACSKANSRQAVPRRSRVGRIYVGFIKSDKALDFMVSAMKQLIALRPMEPILGALTMECRIFYASNRPDLDESLVCDVLQKARVIVNDRQIIAKHVFKGIDKANPRVQVALYANDEGLTGAAKGRRAGRVAV